MLKKLVPTIAFLSASMIFGIASAGSVTFEGKYIGDRSADPERETYANLAPVLSEHVVRFGGAASDIGVVTGNPEKDTFAYPPLVFAADTAGDSVGLVLRKIDETETRAPRPNPRPIPPRVIVLGIEKLPPFGFGGPR